MAKLQKEKRKKNLNDADRCPIIKQFIFLDRERKWESF
jgi:hypothetical protein